VSNQDFRSDLRRAFDEITGVPSSALPDRVRSSVAQAPDVRGPFWLAAVAACLIAALIVGVLVVANGANRRPSPVAPVTTTTPTPEGSPAPKELVFRCNSNSGMTFDFASPPPLASISAVQTGVHQGYDRLTITFGNGVMPSDIEINLQSGTTFVASPSGQQLSVKGANGMLVVMHGADMHTSYSGSIDMVTGYSGLAEVRRVEDFEGTVQLGIGVNVAPCYRSFVLSSPDRLVIDIQTA